MTSTRSPPPSIPLLSGYVRASLPAHEQRRIEAHLEDGSAGDVDPATGIRHHGADDSRRLIEVASSLPEVLPPAIAPGITGMSVEAQRAALGTATRSFGTAAMSAERSDRVRRAVVVGSAIAVVLVLVGVAYLVRQPFDNDDTTSTSTVGPSRRRSRTRRRRPGPRSRRPTPASTRRFRRRPRSICALRRRVRTTRSCWSSTTRWRSDSLRPRPPSPPPSRARLRSSRAVPARST